MRAKWLTEFIGVESLEMPMELLEIVKRPRWLLFFYLMKIITFFFHLILNST